MNRETEIKFLITDKTLTKKLQLFSKISRASTHQTDEVFINKKNKNIIIRIRKERKKNKLKYTLCIKKNTGQELDNAEWEVEITRPNDAGVIISAMGWKKHLTIVKNRKTLPMMGYNVNYDKVRGLGNFIEIEKLSKNNEQKVDFKNIIKALGLNGDQIINKNYITLIKTKPKQKN